LGSNPEPLTNADELEEVLIYPTVLVGGASSKNLSGSTLAG